ncbi:hypothetical protein SAMN06297164_3462 [Nitrosomonas ureae]|uniref:Uncharacterized protein n=1 Tax=Nitrosomonas ureae TaxID=44577 RepID=A0A286AKH9_9PROT|nr:hypothetical protein SAMN06297164_3462 [Nitrosomonas ureae]
MQLGLLKKLERSDEILFLQVTTTLLIFYFQQYIL